MPTRDSFYWRFEQTIYSEWDGECSFSQGKSGSRGVLIQSRKYLNLKIKESTTDGNGNYLILEVIHNETKFELIHVNTPNIAVPDYFNKIFEVMGTFDTEDVIICGDFNLMLDPEIDCYNYKSKNHNKHGRQNLLSIIVSRNLTDPFRKFHNNLRSY